MCRASPPQKSVGTPTEFMAHHKSHDIAGRIKAHSLSSRWPEGRKTFRSTTLSAVPLHNRAWDHESTPYPTCCPLQMSNACDVRNLQGLRSITLAAEPRHNSACVFPPVAGP